MDRRAFLALAAAGLAQSANAQAPAPADLLGATGETYFLTWLNSFYPKAQAAGLPRSLVDHELSGLSADPRVAALDTRQPEFAKPVSDYIHGVISNERVAVGRAKRTNITEFGAIEQSYGVPREILIAIWAMETDFGVLQGGMDVIRCLATLAALGRRRDWAESELIAALRMIATGDVTRYRLRGSWAGAMGQTQLLPSTYLSSAVTIVGHGKPDIWDSPPDALGSAANLLAKSGWRRGEGWAREVILPSGFDYGLSEGPKEVPAWWTAKGVKRPGGLAWPAADTAAPAVLLLPSGASGPAFLALPNHFTIRTYNNSLAYALGVGLLADRFGGGTGVVTPWPHETPLSLTQRMDAQSALIKLGFNPGAPDGVVGVTTRQALRAWQKSQGLVADGYLTPAIVDRLKASAAKA